MSKEKDIKKETEEMETSKAKQAENAAKENAGKDNTEKEAEKKEEKDPLEAAKEEIADLKDKYLRSVAEFDNYRKRTMKEKAELLLNGAEKTVAQYFLCSTIWSALLPAPRRQTMPRL